MASEPNQRQRNILRRLPPSLSIDSAQTLTNRPLTAPERENLATLNKLKEFLATAPARWSPPEAPGSIPFPNPSPRPALNRFSLPSNEYVTCVLWQGQYYISGTDIVRSLVFRFEAFGRPVRNMKKFEEGVFSDLRNLKPGSDATLEEPKVRLIFPRDERRSPDPLLEFVLGLVVQVPVHSNSKEAKGFLLVNTSTFSLRSRFNFFRFSVPHDRLFFDALERDVKRENMGSESATVATNEPAVSFQPNLNSGKTLWEEWIAKVKKSQESGELVVSCFIPSVRTTLTFLRTNLRAQVWVPHPPTRILNPGPEASSCLKAALPTNSDESAAHLSQPVGPTTPAWPRKPNTIGRGDSSGATVSALRAPLNRTWARRGGTTCNISHRTSIHLRCPITPARTFTFPFRTDSQDHTQRLLPTHRPSPSAGQAKAYTWTKHPTSSGLIRRQLPSDRFPMHRNLPPHPLARPTIPIPVPSRGCPKIGILQTCLRLMWHNN
jgi:hypothetical protein